MALVDASLLIKTTNPADTLLTAGQATKANSLPVTMASDQFIPTAVTVLASAAQTTTQTQVDQTTPAGLRGIKVIVDVTVNGAGGSITPEIDFKDPVSGKYIAALTGAAITDTRTVVMNVFPGAPVTTNLSANDQLPTTWRVKVTANNANSVTYSVGAVLLP